MKTRTMLAALTAAFAAALLPAGALADDPTAAIKADLAQLTTDVKAAHDGLLADLTALTADAGKGDKAAVKADVQKLRADRHTLNHAIRADRHKLRQDLKAAKAAGVDPSTIKPLLQAAHQQNGALLKDVLKAGKQARATFKSLRHSLKP